MLLRILFFGLATFFFNPIYADLTNKDFPLIIENNTHLSFTTTILFTAFIAKTSGYTLQDLVREDYQGFDSSLIKIDSFSFDLEDIEYSCYDSDYYFIIKGKSTYSTENNNIQIIKPIISSLKLPVLYTIQEITMTIPYLQESVIFHPSNNDERYIYLAYERESGLSYSLQPTPYYIKTIHNIKNSLIDFFVACWFFTEDTLPY
jgi:hypothetical protein